ncbi:gamma-glutamyltransferase family protein [Rhizobium binxianense]
MFAPHRARIIGQRHMAAAGQYLAAQAAFQILEAGGNAIDAGVAGGITLGIVQAEYVGFGGVAPIMVRIAETGKVWTFSGVGCWPAATDIDVFKRDYGGRIPKGILRTVVPAAPASWLAALDRFGTMSFADVAASALRFARDGFPVPSLMSEIIADAEKEYASYPGNAAIYLPKGRPPEPGEVLVQSDLAKTITYMIDEEKAAGGDRRVGLKAARDAFYLGDIAKAMVHYHQEHGGWLAMSDLAEFEVDVEEVMPVSHNGIEVFTCGPWCQGPVLGQTLGMLDGIDLKSLGHNSPDYVHRLVETLKLAYADRHEYVGDPRFNDVPMDRLLSPAYLRDRAGLVDMAHAFPGMPAPGDVSKYEQPAEKKARPEDALDQIDTSYVCAVDRFGNAFSATPSDGSAGAPVVPGYGFVPSGRGVQSWVDDVSPARVGPKRRPRLTPNPAIMHKPGEWVMPIGSPGNDVQPQAMLQTFLNMTVFGMTPQQAVEAPRFASFSFPRSSMPHSYDPGMLKLESRFPDEVVRTLGDLGHDVSRWPDWEWTAGAVCTIVADFRTGTLEGGSDPRRPTAVVGW